MKKFLVLLCFILTSFQILAQSQESSNALRWAFSWSLKFDGIVKFVDEKDGFNPLFLYDDRMLNRDDLKLSFQMMPTDFYTADLYFFTNFHFRNIRGESEKGDLLIRIRPGVGLNNIFSFADHCEALLGVEYRVDISDFKKYKHRLAVSTALEGGGAPGFSWSLGQNFLPRFTAEKGFSEMEYETEASLSYELLQHKTDRNPDVTLSLTNDFYFDTTNYPDSNDEEFYIEESLGLKTSWKKTVHFSFAPSYFYKHNETYENNSLFGFKSALGASFSSQRKRENPVRYTLSVGYWGAWNFNRHTWDHLLQLTLSLSQTVKPQPSRLAR